LGLWTWNSVVLAIYSSPHYLQNIQRSRREAKESFDKEEKYISLCPLNEISFNWIILEISTFLH
jgi:hypothetical protein